MRDERGSRFAGWLQSSMSSVGLTQAQLARSVGVADTQVSRWRRGQVVPSLPYLQRLADTFGIERMTLDQLVGLPVAQVGPDTDPRLEAELQAHQARMREVLQHKLPHAMWRAYVEACIALGDTLAESMTRVLRDSLAAPDAPLQEKTEPPERPLGFRA